MSKLLRIFEAAVRDAGRAEALMYETSSRRAPAVILGDIEVLRERGEHGKAQHDRDGMREPVGDHHVGARVASAPREPGHEVAEGERDADTDRDVRDRGARREAETAALKKLFHRLANASGAEDPPALRTLSSPAPRRVRSSPGGARRDARDCAP